MESESVLREGLCRNSLRSPGDTLHARSGGAIRDHRSQWNARRRIARASTTGIRQVETRSGAASPISARSPIAFAEAFDARARLVSANTSRRRKMAMARLSRQSALRGTKPISVFHGEYAPAAEPEGLRLLRHGARCFAEEVRSNAR